MPLPRVRIRWICVFIGLVWLGATFAYIGDTGKHSDDYWATLRAVDRAGLDWSRHPWFSFPYFWRPLHLLHVWTVNTLFWKLDALAHLELALVHAAVYGLLYRLLTAMGSARGVAFAAVLLAGTCPLLGEAILWSSASCNAIGSMFMLLALLAGHRFGHSPRGMGGLATIALLSLTAACFYEPAAAGLAGMPIVVWWACSQHDRGESRVRRTILATNAAGLPCVLYALLLITTAPPDARGGSESLLRTANSSGVLGPIFSGIREWVAGDGGRDVVLGSIEHGLSAAGSQPMLLGILLAIGVSGVLALIQEARKQTTRPTASESRARGAGLGVFLLAIVLMIMPWTPFVAAGAQGVEMRSLYVPMLGVSCVIAAAGSELARLARRVGWAERAPIRAAAMFIVGGCSIAGVIGLMGMQTQFRTNARLDAHVASQLNAIAPALAPGTALLILAAEHRGAATSRATYNGVIHTAPEARWSARVFVWRAMQRRDLRVITGAYWSRGYVPLDQLTDTSARRTEGNARVPIVPWDNIVPLWIDRDANVHIVDALTIEPLGGRPRMVRMPRAEEVASARPAAVTERRREMRVRLIETVEQRSRVVIGE
ncbi:MAG: hypothetical protein K2W85_15055 [Phycisphaerales bacterium]|nr:hypothetical protein [Phycisphaerales bacterium]